ncbi:Glu/Leu/Phe/Val dehydrogenase dimerization domain-containing protein [Kitasatospora sp. NPDC096077]|uniref:Glu/Leu/Phe/Val dehydrogenase dimerization domain-containing protein n=1 Tax=Kitasatospora sp. NPDC096077 TaxID=3155544 RepID=UPI00332649EF
MPNRLAHPAAPPTVTHSAPSAPPTTVSDKTVDVTPDGPHLSVVWRDEPTGARGYLVVDRLRRGVASGGLRMRAGCTLAEVTDLAALMTLKEALVRSPDDRYQPFGGAKGGIDFDPRDPAAQDVLNRYIAAMRPLIATRWALGEDLGLHQSDIDAAVTAAGLRSSVQAALPFVPDGAGTGLRRLAEAFAAEVDGIGLGDLVGGFGVAQAVLAVLADRGEPAAGRTAFVQGFGSMGGATARYLARAGIRVVGVCDAEGVVASADGLDVERLLATRTADGRIDRSALRPGDVVLSGAHWLAVDCDVLVTAAVSYAVDEGNADAVRARYLVEAANASVTAAAERRLLARGVLVLPDFLANCAANSWWWWTLFGDVEPTPASAFGRIGRTMRELCGQVLAGARAESVAPREIARRIAEANAR